MAKQRKIGAIIALDGEQAFKKSVTECNKALTTMKSEMKLVAAETSGSANTLDSLKKKHETLQKTLDASVDKEKAVKEGLDNAKKQYDKVGGVLDDYKEKLSAAKKKLEEMEDSQDASSDAIDEQKRTVAELSSNVEQVESVYKKAGDRVQVWEKSLNDAKTETIKASNALKENDTYMKEAADSTDDTSKSIDEFGKKVKDAGDKVVSMGTVVKANLVNTLVDAGKSLAKSAFDSAIEGAVGLETAVNNLAASTGSSKEEMEGYKDVLQEMYADNYGDSLEDLADAMAKVKQYTNETDPDKIKSLTESALTLSDTFDIDINESLRAATTLMDEFGLTAEDAYDMMATGAQNGLNKSDELADNIAEYGSLWSQAGFSAEEMFAIMENGLDSGAYNLDKVNDFVKEFGNSLADGRIESNLSNFSSNTQDLFYQWKNGEATTKDVFMSVINDLDSMANKQEALTIASDTWSALGEDNSMKVITSLNDVNDAYDDVQGTMEEIKDIKYDGVAQSWEQLGRTFQTEIAAPIAEDFLPIAEEGIEFLSEHLDAIIPVVAGIGTAFAAKKLIDGIAGITTSLIANVTATEGATTAMTIFNGVLSANPVGLVVTGIGMLTTAALLFSDNVEVAKTATQELADAADEVNASALTAADELDSATSEISTAMDGSDASASTAYRLVDELEDLAGKSSLTATEQSRLSTIVAELNTLFPDMALAIDDSTGSLNMSIDAIDEYVDSAVEIGKIEAVQKAVKEATEKLVDAEIERSKAEAQLEDTNNALKDIEDKRSEAEDAVIAKNDALKEAQEDYNEALATGAENTDELYLKTLDNSEAQIEYNGSLMTVSEAYKQMAEDSQVLTETQAEQQEVLDTLNESLANGQAEIDTYSEYLKEHTASTIDNTDAIFNNTDAANANAEAQATQQEAYQASIEVAGQELEAFNNLSQSQQELATHITDTVTTMQQSVKDSLESQMNMFEEFDAGTAISTEQLLANMQSQIDGVTSWEQQMAELANRGINEDMLLALADMGPEGTAYVTAFNSMTDEEFQKANDLWAQSVDIKSMTDDWGTTLTESVGDLASGTEEAWTDLAESLNMSANESGEYVVQGLVDGMANAQSQAEEQGVALGESAVDSVDEGAGVESPSKKTKQSGEYIVQGLSNGIKDKTSVAKSAAKTLGTGTVEAVKTGIMSREKSVLQEVTTFANNIVSTMRSGLQNGQSTVSNAAAMLGSVASNSVSRNVNMTSAYYAGYNLAIGMANGISRGQSAVVNAAANMCQAAINQARRSLQINSPSKVFEQIGSYAAQGLPVGFSKETANVQRSIADSMSDISNQALGSVDWSAVSGTGSGMGDITLQIPVYMNGVLTETQVEKISLNALNKTQRKINSAKGVRTVAFA